MIRYEKDSPNIGTALHKRLLFRFEFQQKPCYPKSDNRALLTLYGSDKEPQILYLQYTTSWLSPPVRYRVVSETLYSGNLIYNIRIIPGYAILLHSENLLKPCLFYFTLKCSSCLIIVVHSFFICHMLCHFIIMFSQFMISSIVKLDSKQVFP